MIMVTSPRIVGTALSRQQLAGIVGEVSRGNETAFERLNAATCAKLYAIVLRIVRRRDVANEVLQDVYLRIWQHAGQFNALRSSPITWMATIARYRALDEVHRAALPSIEDEFELVERAAEYSPLIEYERAEDARRLQACLERLGPEKSALIVQAYCYGMTRKEIAKVTGRPVSTIKTSLRRTLAELRRHLEEHGAIARKTPTPRTALSPARGECSHVLREASPWRSKPHIETMRANMMANEWAGSGGTGAACCLPQSVAACDSGWARLALPAAVPYRHSMTPPQNGCRPCEH
jgi:RNA polymerase sigma-70 factor (ECF subfamily)